jgi:hypothetical protein
MNQITRYTLCEFGRTSAALIVHHDFVRILAETVANRNLIAQLNQRAGGYRSELIRNVGRNRNQAMRVPVGHWLQDFLLDRDVTIGLMGEELTRKLPDNRSFEERVFARFDAMDARFDSIHRRFEGIDRRFDAVDVRLDRTDARLDGIDQRVQALEARALDTKPIWEHALSEILAVRNGVDNLNRKMDVLTLDMMQLRADQRRVEKRMDGLESRLQ